MTENSVLLQKDTPLKVSIVVKDTWAVWHSDDLRGLRAPEFNNAVLQDWYGCDSQKWNELLQNTNLKPEIMFVGENPSKNNKKILNDVNLTIQCFHSSSRQDLFIKQLIEENSYFRGSYMTDAFDSAFEDDGRKITLGDIKRKYKTEWQGIFNKARDRFIHLLEHKDHTIAIVFGGEAFKYVQQFTEGTFHKGEIENLENDIKSLALSRGERKCQVFKIHHPSPATYPKYRRQIQLQMKSLARIISETVI